MKKCITLSLGSLALAAALHACSSAPTRLPASQDSGLANERLAADGLPTTADVDSYFEFIGKLDLTDPAYVFNVGTGGMSIHLEFTGPAPAKIHGDFVSANPDGRGDNTSGNPEGQVLEYNLSRLFDCSANFGKGHWFKVSGRPVDALRSLAEQKTSSNPNVVEAKRRILQTTANPVVDGTVSVYGPKPHNADSLIVNDDANGSFNSDSALAKLIRADGARPQDRALSMENVTFNELESARFLSSVFLIDVMSDQFDRFSGGNIQYIVDSAGLAHLVAYDNNGSAIAGWGTNYLGRYLGWTTRFDRSTALRIVELDAFINHGSAQFLNFKTPDALMDALGLRAFRTYFKTRLGVVAAHVNAVMKNNCADGQCFF